MFERPGGALATMLYIPCKHRDLGERLEALASEQDRSVSYVVVAAVREYLERQKEEG